MSVPIAGEARPIYPRYSAGSPTYLRHEARCPAPTRAGVMSGVAPRLVGRHCAGSACGLFLVRAAFRRPSDPHRHSRSIRSAVCRQPRVRVKLPQIDGTTTHPVPSQLSEHATQHAGDCIRLDGNGHLSTPWARRLPRYVT